MISIETARALKEANVLGRERFILQALRIDVVKTIQRLSLEALLAEIEKRGYVWLMDVSATKGKTINGYAFIIATDLSWVGGKEFRDDSPDEAVAQALLWILKEGSA